jgi:hypothetical protein
MRRPERRGGARVAIAVLLLVCATGGGAYEPDVHQQLTFLAAKQLNRCLGDDVSAQLSPLQVRGIANSNVGLADSNFFQKLVRWSYYDPLEREDTSIAWVLNTRFNDHFQELVQELDEAESESEELRELGRIISYVQLVTSPTRAVPVYTPRFWRWTLSDRFDGFPLQEAQLEARLGEDCSHLAATPASYEAILAATATETIASLHGPIGRLPATWEAFWELPEEPGEFGNYGPAGNSFGRYTDFQCGEEDTLHRCVLITDDPAYTAFAVERQLAAVRATAQTMLLFRRSETVAARRQPPAPGQREVPAHTAGAPDAARHAE